MDVEQTAPDTETIPKKLTKSQRYQQKNREKINKANAERARRKRREARELKEAQAAAALQAAGGPFVMHPIPSAQPPIPQLLPPPQIPTTPGTSLVLVPSSSTEPALQHFQKPPEPFSLHTPADFSTAPQPSSSTSPPPQDPLRSVFAPPPGVTGPNGAPVISQYDRFVEIRDHARWWSTPWGGQTAWPESLDAIFNSPPPPPAALPPNFNDKDDSPADREGELLDFAVEVLEHAERGKDLLRRLQGLEGELPSDPRAIRLLWKMHMDTLASLASGIAVLEARVPLAIKRKLFKAARVTGALPMSPSNSATPKAPEFTPTPGREAESIEVDDNNTLVDVDNPEQ